MTAQKHLKQRVRARMEKTGERYAAARRQILRDTGAPDLALAPTLPAAHAHLPGNVPATTALRILLAHAGRDLSEAMLFGIAGGIGVGVFSFYYEREDQATFFLGGRHQWYDDAAYLRAALARLGVEPLVEESGGARAAEQQLRALLADGHPCIAWVDLALLPHRAMPAAWAGGGYHVVTVYAIDDTTGSALIGDLSDEPIALSLADLARARARIAKQRHRLLALPAGQTAGQGQTGGPDSSGVLRPLALGSHGASLADQIWAGLRACHDGLIHAGLPGMGATNARLAALGVWAERMASAKAKERWERVYRPGPNLVRGLGAIYHFVEHYGTGGGLCRPLFADFLGEAATRLGHPALADLAERYAALGRAWSDLADAALPADAPMLREVKELYARKAELHASGAPAAEVGAVWQRLGEIEEQARDAPPLSAAAYAVLRADLHTRIAALHAGEVAAHAALGAALPG